MSTPLLCSVSQTRSLPNIATARSRGVASRQQVAQGQAGLDIDADLAAVAFFAGGDAACQPLQQVGRDRPCACRTRPASDAAACGRGCVASSLPAPSPVPRGAAAAEVAAAAGAAPAAATAATPTAAATAPAPASDPGPAAAPPLPREPNPPPDNIENSSATKAAIAATTRLDVMSRATTPDACARRQGAELASQDAAQHAADHRHGDEQEDGQVHPVEALAGAALRGLPWARAALRR